MEKFRTAMLIVLSPAKSLDLESPLTTPHQSTPDFIAHAGELIEVLRGHSPASISELKPIMDKRGRRSCRSMATCTRASTRAR
jgi:cytoplasmic iron level regulating protein YaaA (DUF328/UPF0246 family)